MANRISEADIRHLAEFKKTLLEARNSLDPQLRAWKDEPATAAQIRYIYVLGKHAGIAASELRDRYSLQDGSLTKGEVQVIIEELTG